MGEGERAENVCVFLAGRKGVTRLKFRLKRSKHHKHPAGMEAVAEWAATPDDVCKTVCRHLDLGALVRFGAVCRAWRQAAACPEAWEEVYRASWGDDEVLQGCSDLAQSFEKRWAL
ncbi:MAG: F-box protein, partial [Promethearchaeia archaeon]